MAEIIRSIIRYTVFPFSRVPHTPKYTASPSERKKRAKNGGPLYIRYTVFPYSGVPYIPLRLLGEKGGQKIEVHYTVYRFSLIAGPLIFRFPLWDGPLLRDMRDIKPKQ